MIHPAALVHSIFDSTIAPNDRALLCMKALTGGGIVLDATATVNGVAGVCGCGHPFAGRTLESAYAALSAHFTARVEQ